MASVTEQLKDLAALLKEGLITREQFEEQRDQLLADSRSASQTPSDPTMLTEVGAYRLLGLIGEGGMGAVYRGRHRSETMAERQGGDVAVKVMHAQYARNSDYRDRFEREAALGMKLDHPGIVKVHDLVVDGGNLALVMEFVDGQSLGEQIGEAVGPIPWDKAWPLFQKLLEAVEYAHEQGVVHRDIKPENVLVAANGRPLVIDFGIAKDLDASRTRTGTGMGTVEYMAPEQYTNAKTVDRRADIYSLGMMLYEMLAGRLPWDTDAPQFRILEQKANKELMSPSAFCKDIPSEIVAALSPAFSADPTTRPATARNFADALVEASTKTAARVREARLLAAREEEARRAAALASQEAREAEQRKEKESREHHGELRVEPGTFQMGSPEEDGGRYRDGTLHEVQITHPFGLSMYPVTQALYEAVTGKNPSHFKGWMHPVERVSWHDAVCFCNRLSESEGLQPAYRISGTRVAWDRSTHGYRLPTEAEWEYAARAGEQHLYAGSDEVDDVAWYSSNSGGRTHEVGGKQANTWGLRDMSGNVWEWVWDRYGEHPSGTVADPVGPSTGFDRVLRGGSWSNLPRNARVADRYRLDPDYRNSNLGFRLARSLP